MKHQRIETMKIEVSELNSARDCHVSSVNSRTEDTRRHRARRADINATVPSGREAERDDRQMAVPVDEVHLQLDSLAHAATRHSARATVPERVLAADLHPDAAVGGHLARQHLRGRGPAEERVRPVDGVPVEVESDSALISAKPKGTVMRRSPSSFSDLKNRSTTAMEPCLPSAPKRGLALRFVHHASYASLVNCTPWSLMMCLGARPANSTPRSSTSHTSAAVGSRLKTPRATGAREKWSTATTMCQEKGQHVGTVKGHQGVQKPPKVGIVVMSTCQTWWA